MRLLKWLLATSVLVSLVVAALAYGWTQRPLPLALDGEQVLDVTIPPGSSAQGTARTLQQAGVQVPAGVLGLWLRLSGQARKIKAGSYELAEGTTPAQLLDKLVRGEQAVRRVTLVEGWNYRQVLQALRAADHLYYDLPANPAPRALMQTLGLPATHPEGRFFPDTYVYPKNATASSVLQQAAAAMDAQLAQAWAQRAPGLPLRSPDEALILASLVEKETGQAADRAQIAAVFVNRLRIGMRLQTDPSVIYGLGAAFNGNLRKRDLQADTPYNTYTRAGLPPTPIALPGADALHAATHPANSQALYFVARGDGSSQFSRTLDEHNRAVQRYIFQR